MIEVEARSKFTNQFGYHDIFQLTSDRSVCAVALGERSNFKDQGHWTFATYAFFLA